jgi:tetratricopeptide (TPR) repeat protein
VLDAYAGITKIVHADDAKAIELYKKAIELEPNIKQSRLLLGVIYIEERKYDEAIKILEEDVKRKENYTKLFHLGRAYYGKGSDKEALETWLRAYKLAPDYLPLNVDLALVNISLNNFSEAKKYYLNAIKLGGLDSVDAKLIQNMGFLEKY